MLLGSSQAKGDAMRFAKMSGLRSGCADVLPYLQFAHLTEKEYGMLSAADHSTLRSPWSPLALDAPSIRRLVARHLLYPCGATWHLTHFGEDVLDVLTFLRVRGDSQQPPKRPNMSHGRNMVLDTAYPHAAHLLM